ncbi:HD domain-containing protein [Phototrophicus methaneseepsis]|uniref:HD domain-containing protein n=1 Tax=Phototrophicus methaneseepsis TaxID=2710758 RepID=A0A7S8ED91_9CHLR|nr:HD domain-containing protein [Phototrophicus methaneseepsis]QPC84845.1 HD domain-containing protein [Phototrophicus methaneseepsis]
MAITTRLKQGLRALFAFSTPIDIELAQHYLSRSQLALFQQMARPEQLHSLNVLRTLLAQETHTSPELAAAALLHDVGKARYHMAVWQKTASVLTEKLAPSLFDQLSQEEGHLRWWRAPFVVREQHPAWGAQMLREIDAAPGLIWLVEHHADPFSQWKDHPQAPLLARLKAADDAN